MLDQTLTTLRRNEVFELVQLGNLDPALLHWDRVASQLAPGRATVSRLVLKSDPSYFYQFDYHGSGSEFAIFSPGASKRLEQTHLGSWAYHMKYVHDWATRLSQELQARDLWVELAAYSEGALTGAYLDDDRPISVEEVLSIQAASERLAAALAEAFPLTQEQIAFVEQKLDFLVDSAHRQTKMAWVHTALGVFMTIAWAVSPEDVGYYWKLIRDAFRGVMFLVAPGG